MRRPRPGGRLSARSTRSATSPAFHAPQAEGPVARLSASVRAPSRWRVDAVAGGPGHAGDGGRVIEVAAGGGVGQQEVVAHEVDEHVDVVGREAHPGGNALDDLHADLGVVAGEALADVVEQRADEQEVRPLDRIGQLGGQRRQPRAGAGRR